MRDVLVGVIVGVTECRKKFTSLDATAFNEGLLRQCSLFMRPGKLRTIRFEFTGASIQAVLDKLPTVRVIERNGRTYTVEAEVYGDGIKMWILSQGHRTKVIAPDGFVEEMKFSHKKFKVFCMARSFRAVNLPARPPRNPVLRRAAGS